MFQPAMFVDPGVYVTVREGIHHPTNPIKSIMHLAPQRNPQQPPHLSNHRELTERWDKRRWKIQLCTTLVIYPFTKKTHGVVEKSFYITMHKGLIKAYISQKKTRSKQCIYLESNPSNLMYHTKIFNPSQPLGTLYWPNFSGSFFFVGETCHFLGVLSGLGSFKALRPIYTDLVIRPDVWTINSFGSRFA